MIPNNKSFIQYYQLCPTIQLRGDIFVPLGFQ